MKSSATVKGFGPILDAYRARNEYLCSLHDVPEDEFDSLVDLNEALLGKVVGLKAHTAAEAIAAFEILRRRCETTADFDETSAALADAVQHYLARAANGGTNGRSKA
jgi:hypothetical protein